MHRCVCVCVCVCEREFHLFFLFECVIVYIDIVYSSNENQ